MIAKVAVVVTVWVNVVNERKPVVSVMVFVKERFSVVVF